MTDKSSGFWEAGFYVGVLLSCVSIFLGASVLIEGMLTPTLRSSPAILGILGFTEAWIVFCMAGSVRLIGRRIRDGWYLLLGCSFLALIVTPITAVYGMIALKYL